MLPPRSAAAAVRQRPSPSIPHGAATWANSWHTSHGWASRRSPESRTSRPRRARTNASSRPCSATSTSSHSPTRWPNCRPRSTGSTTSTTPNVLTKDSPDGSHPTGLGGHRESRGSPAQSRAAALVQAATNALRTGRRRRTCPPAPPSDDLTSAGTFMLGKVIYLVGGQHGFQQVLVVVDGDTITVADSEARSSSNTPDQHPASSTSATANPADHAPRPPNRHRSPDTPTVTNVLMQNCHPCPETSHGIPNALGRIGSLTRPEA